MILIYIHPDPDRRQALGFWDPADPAFNAAVDQIYLLTDGRVSAVYDPRFLFWDVDVPVIPTTWGAIKDLWRHWLPVRILDR